jgi:hypothetical protein
MFTSLTCFFLLLHFKCVCTNVNFMFIGLFSADDIFTLYAIAFWINKLISYLILSYFVELTVGYGTPRLNGAL